MAALIVFGVLFTDACAKGYPTPPEGLADALGSTPAGSGGTGSGGNNAAAGSGTAGAGGAGTGGGTMGGPSAADQCARGETNVCTCEATQTEGERACVANAASPSGGYFGACENCKAKAPEPGTTGGSGAGGSGSGGSGSGGSGAGGSGGSGTTPSSCTAMPTMCTGFLACCKADGKCGGGFGPLCF